MKRFMILSALFVSALFIAGCGEEKKQTYEELLRSRIANVSDHNGFVPMTYDKVADTLILKAALEHFGEGFDYEITDYGIHKLPYYEIKDTLFIYYDKYDNKYDTVDRYIARIRDGYPNICKYVKTLERTEKTYVDTTDIVAICYSSKKTFNSTTQKADMNCLNFIMLVRDNDIKIYEMEYDRPETFSFYREEYEYKEIK